MRDVEREKQSFDTTKAYARSNMPSNGFGMHNGPTWKKSLEKRNVCEFTCDH